MSNASYTIFVIPTNSFPSGYLQKNYCRYTLTDSYTNILTRYPADPPGAQCSPDGVIEPGVNTGYIWDLLRWPTSKRHRPTSTLADWLLCLFCGCYKFSKTVGL